MRGQEPGSRAAGCWALHSPNPSFTTRAAAEFQNYWNANRAVSGSPAWLGGPQRARLHPRGSRVPRRAPRPHCPHPTAATPATRLAPQAVNRTLAVMLSGRPTWGGIAYSGAVSNPVQYWGTLGRWEASRRYPGQIPDAGYAYAGSLSGSLQWGGDRVSRGTCGGAALGGGLRRHWPVGSPALCGARPSSTEHRSRRSRACPPAERQPGGRGVGCHCGHARNR